MRRSLRARSYTASAIRLILAGRRPDTQRGYNLKWYKWVAWCALQEPSVDTIKPEPHVLAVFLGYLSEVLRLKPATLCVYRSTITQLSVTFADVRRPFTPHRLQCGVC